MGARRACDGVPAGCKASPAAWGLRAARAAGRPKIAAWEELATAREDPRPAHAREGPQKPFFRGLGGVSLGSGGVSCGSGGIRGNRDPATWGDAAGEPRRRATRGAGSSQTANYGPFGGVSCARRGAGCPLKGLRAA